MFSSSRASRTTRWTVAACLGEEDRGLTTGVASSHYHRITRTHRRSRPSRCEQVHSRATTAMSGRPQRSQTRPVQPRRLLLVRHANAADAPSDVDRPLTERGARQAAAIGAWLEQAGLVPDRVLVSSARRAEETWERAVAAQGTGPRPIVDARIYDNTVEALL